MEAVNNWKRTLLQWINECNFLDKPYYNIEQSEVDAFFIRFRNHIKGDICKNKDLSSFLKENYPMFEPHYDDENAMSSSDYVYVYSLLLHFSCVMCPNESFQKKCQQLNESLQQNIATFFKKLLEANSVTKETLRHAIASITASPPPKIPLICMESPMKTPRKTEISPSTPRSCLLQERNKELHNLKARLEFELYEKGVLDIELRKNQEKIAKLSRELKTSHQEIKDLKNDIFSRNSESEEVRHSEEEQQLNRRLCKQISQRELEIDKQREEIDALTEQKDILNEKLNHAEKQMKMFQNKIEEFALNVDELTAELEQKSGMIQYLSESKFELEHYISEIRSSSASSRPDLNISVECLDLSRTTNSSGSINSPENLGCSVVDIQLREKENENVQLRDEISIIRLDNAKLAKHINDLTVGYSKLFDICNDNENLIIDNENDNHIENFMVFSKYVQKFIHKYEETLVSLNMLKDHAKEKGDQNSLLSSKIGEVESEVVSLKKEIHDLQEREKALKVSKTSLENEVCNWETKLEKSLREQLDVTKNLENLQNELESLKNEKNNADRVFKQEIEVLKADLENSQEHYTKIKSDFENKLKTIESLEKYMKSQHESDIRSLEDKLNVSSEKIIESENKLQQLVSEKQDYEKKIHDLMYQYSCKEKCLLEKLDKVEVQLLQKANLINELEKQKNSLATELDETKRHYDHCTKEKKNLLKEIEEKKDQIISLTKTLEDNEQALQRLNDNQIQNRLIITNLQADNEVLINAISKSNAEIADVGGKLVRTEAELKICQTDIDNIHSKYNASAGLLSEQTEHFSNVIDELNTKLQEVMENIDINTPKNDFVEKDVMFLVTLDSTDAVDKLKQYANAIVQKLRQITLVNAQNEELVANLTESERKLVQQKKELESKLLNSERQNLELREDLEDELQCENKKLANEVKRLNDDISNLENVCDRLTEENSSLRSKLSEFEMVSSNLTQENKLLKARTSVLEADHLNQLSIAQKLTKTETELRTQVKNMQLSVKNLEMDIEEVQKLLLTKTRDAELLKDERDEAYGNIESMRKQVSELKLKVVDLECDSDKIIKNHDAAKEMLEQSANEQFKQLENLKVLLESEVTEKRRVKKELDVSNEHLNEVKNENIMLENKCQLMDMNLDNVKKDLVLSNSELARLQSEETRLLGEIALIKETNFSMETKVEKCNKELIEQKENISQLINEIASIRREKQAVEEEKNTLTKHYEQKISTHMSLDANYKSIVEKLHLAERDLLTKQNLLKSEELKSKDLENQLMKLQMENAKLKETNENNIKRMEKQALKLGETQAKSLRLKKDAEVTQNSLELLKSSTDTLRRENIKLNLEYKSLKEKSSKYEKEYNQLESKLEILEQEKKVLDLQKENIETSENELKSTQATLEKNKANLEDRVRKLNKSFSESNVAISRLEQEKVQLNLEIGGLNTQLQESKSLLSMKLKETQDVTTNLIEVKNVNLKLMELNEKLQVDANELRDENASLYDQLSKLSLRLQITQEGHESTKSELKLLQAELDAKSSEINTIKKEHMMKIERLKEVEELFDARKSMETELENKIKTLDMQLSRMSSELSDMEQMRIQEKLTNDKLNTDISILQAKLHKSRSICEENEAKWNEEKQQLLNEVTVRDERIKETRLELEGKLEKMKNKMKTLYNDEITKMKNKQEREMAVMKSEINVLKPQNKKYEENTKKLSSQIFRLNENILEHQKQNTFLKTKLKDLETKSRQFNRITTTHGPESSAHQALSSNLHMEDEEGEVFNNTYLSDLKNGRMSELFCRDISVQELQYRNSLLPPHLKSTYLAQFDHQMGEDEIRETPSLDDSSSTLLNTGQRKKVSGATSYKRPGPPTPSKNAGRLSFGGNGELNREILRETHDIRNGASSSKTPAKFKLFSSRLSMKDERTSYVTTFKRKQHIIGTIHCSSTPRKSKAHFDQRRLLDQIMSTTSPGPEESAYNLVSPAITLPPTLKISELNRRISRKWRQPKQATTDSGTSDVNSPISTNVKYEIDCKRSKRLKDRRGSIYLRGTMFARNCRTPNPSLREFFKNKSKIQRNANFNKYRSEMSNQLTSNWPCNNNNKNVIEEYKDSNAFTHNSGVSEVIYNDTTSKYFQQLLLKKESHAPFEISEINGPSYLNGNSSSTVHSRTIYGASVILNRKIPNVNKTFVRKNSIYVKANDGQGIIFVTNQTITLMDLAQMWIQMNISAKVVIGLSLTTLCVAMFCFVIQLLL